jgi:hypothetical protein
MRRCAPVFALILLSPLLAEVCFGATPVSRLSSLALIVPFYGSAVVLIRELARSRGAGWARIVLLGAAHGIIEEGLTLQSMFNPEMFNAGRLGGRFLGINWVWSEWTIGYHVVWSAAIPILIAELMFPDRRNEPWVGKLGLVIAVPIYAMCAVALGIAIRTSVAPDFQTPFPHAVAAALTAAGFVALALCWPGSSTTPEIAIPHAAARKAPSPWLVGTIAFVAAGLLFGLIFLPDAVRRGPLVLAPMAFDLAVFAGVWRLIRHWSAPDSSWTDVHRLALALGALPVSMLFGFFYVTASNPADRAFLTVVNVLTLALLGNFARRLRTRQTVVVG